MSIFQTDEDARRRIVLLGRIWAIGAAVWALAYVSIYIFQVTRFGSDIAWAYVANVVVGIGLIVWSFFVPYGRMLLQIAAVVLAVASIIGLISIGILLTPAVVITLIAARRIYHP